MDDDVALLCVSGKVDSANVGEFEEGLFVASEGESRVVIDLTDFEYVSSAGLRVPLMLQKKYGQGDALSICNVNDEVMDIFNVTGFSKLLRIV